MNQELKQRIEAKLGGLNILGKRKDSSIAEVLKETHEHFADEGVPMLVIGSVYAEMKEAYELYKAERKAGKKPAKEMKPAELVKTAEIKGEQLPEGVYLVTYAQNNTEPVAYMLEALQVMAKQYDAKILIVAGEYNKALFGHGESEIYYAPELVPFMAPRGVDLLLGGSFIVAGSANVLPTARRPCSGFENYSTRHTIIPHTQFGLQLCATGGDMPKRLIATGSITERNYIDNRKAGAVASPLHSFGVLLVDTTKGITRNIPYRDGVFYDGRMRFGFDGHVGQTRNVAGLVFGDCHAEKQEADALDYMLAMLDAYKPQTTVLHDLLDFSAENHHNRASSWHRHKNQHNTVVGDFLQAVHLLNDLDNNGNAGSIRVVCSNHDRAADRWLQEAKQNEVRPCDLLTWHELNALVLSGKASDPLLKTLLEYAVIREYGEKSEAFAMLQSIEFLARDELSEVVGVDVSHHGDSGANGARGSLAGFAKLGKPVVIGHSHQPGVLGNAWQVGVSSREHDFGYNFGPSAWSQGDVIIHENGLRQMILPPLFN